MNIDASELRTLSRDLGTLPTRVAFEVSRSIFKGATSIKAAMQRDARASIHWGGFAGDIDFDTILAADSFAAEIGPRVGPGRPGNLANLAYTGYSRGAAGTVRPPEAALDDEAPKFERALGDILGGAL